MILAALVVLSVLFAVAHIGMSHGAFRSRLVEKLGLWPFRGLYSLVSLVTLIGAAVIFWQHRHLGPELWSAPGWLSAVVAFPLMFLGIELLVLILGSPSPASMIPAKAESRAVLRITRHPMNMAFACFGLAHLIPNGSLGDVSFFGSIFFVGFFGAYHQDRRLARERGDAFRKFQGETSIFPFAAVVRGKTRLAWDELSFPLVVLGALAFVALVLFHGRLFGASLL